MTQSGNTAYPKRKKGFSGLAVAAAALVVVFIAALIFFTQAGPAADTPAVILPSPVVAGAATAGPEEFDPHSRRVEVTPETVQAVISTLTRASDYSRVMEVERFAGGKSVLSVINVQIHGRNARISINNGFAVKDILIKGDEIRISYSDSQGVYYGRLSEDGAVEADEYQGLLTYEDISSLDRRNIIDAGYVDYNGEACVFAEYISGAFGYRNIVYISVDTGLIMANDMYDGDELVYRMISGAPDISTPDDEFFTLPAR